MLVEAEIAGYGASGRNGAWLSAGFPMSAARLQRRFGRQAATDLLLAMADTVENVSQVIEKESIDGQFRRGGVLRVARGTHQVPAIRAAFQAYERLGFSDRCRLIDRAETMERVQVNNAKGALAMDDGAVVHPGRLVRGLARAVERAGGMIHERSVVTKFQGLPAAELTTDEGSVSSPVIVLAGEAYQTRLRPLHRSVLPLFSQIVLTEPLSESLWDEIGWRGDECLSSTRYTIDYLSRTADGRILFGSRGAPYRFASRIDPAEAIDAGTDAMIRRMLIDWFPALRDIGISYRWGGVLGMPRDWMPTASYDKAGGIARIGGYTGQGVATSNLAGRILADLIQEVDSPLVHLPMANHRSPAWEPEPFRWLAARYVQWGLERVDLKMERTGRRPRHHTLAERLAEH